MGCSAFRCSSMVYIVPFLCILVRKFYSPCHKGVWKNTGTRNKSRNLCKINKLFVRFLYAAIFWGLDNITNPRIAVDGYWYCPKALQKADENPLEILVG